MPDTAAPLTLGVQSDGRYGAFYGAFDGAIDELAVYDIELPGERVVAHRDAAR